MLNNSEKPLILIANCHTVDTNVRVFRWASIKFVTTNCAREVPLQSIKIGGKIHDISL